MLKKVQAAVATANPRIDIIEQNIVFKAVASLNTKTDRQLFCCKVTLVLVQSTYTSEPGHEISNNVVCATSKASDQPGHKPSLIRAFASRWNIL